MDLYKARPYTIIIFLLLAVASAWLAYNKTSFTYDFEQFFPRGDKELDFYYEFREKFEPDDNFLLIGIPNQPSVFQQSFLLKVDSLTRDLMAYDQLKSVGSITNFRYFVKTPFAATSFPAVKLQEPQGYPGDSTRIMTDERLVTNLISRDADALIIATKTLDSLNTMESRAVVDTVMKMAAGYFGTQGYHLIGKANFEKVLTDVIKVDFLRSTIISGFLVSLVFLLVFRRPIGVGIALFSVVLAMLLFIGFLVLLGPLDYMAALFPILMIIVGVSDVVHFMTRYVGELRLHNNRRQAMKNTMREIGLATLLTSVTTGIGFMTLLTSKVPPVRNFGIMAAVGVIIAYLTVLLFTTSALSSFGANQISRFKEGETDRWKTGLEAFYHWARRNTKAILIGTLLFFGFTAYGISLVSTDIHVSKGLPRGHKITTDFLFFEEEFSGFRPFEIAAIVKDSSHRINDWAVLHEIDKLEQYLHHYPEVNGISSITAVYKSLNRASNGNQLSYYRLPDTEAEFKMQSRLLEQTGAGGNLHVLMSNDSMYGRISAKVYDIGTDSIRMIMGHIDSFIAHEIDTNLVTFRQTGTGVIIDKNNEYLRGSLIGGLSIAFVAVSLLMALLFRDLRYVVISLIPNVIPLLLAGAAIGYLGIELDAPTAIIFAVSFGIAVDDTIHFLSKLRIELGKGRELEDAIRITIIETGKAIVITTIILFFGFLILLFSTGQGTRSIGMLISITLFSALFADLLLIPIMLRWWVKKPDRK